MIELLLPGAVPDFVREAQSILREGSTFQWSTVTLLGLVVYVYSVEVERRRWDIVLAGLAFSMMDLFNEMVNSAIFHLTDRAPLWTVTGDTSYLIFIGLTIEILLLFAVSGVAFVKTLPPDRKAKILGIPNRIVFVTVFSLFCVAVEIFLHSTGYFHWEYWWWNVPFVPLIVIFGYATFFAVAAWVYDMGSNTRKQVRVVGTMAAINLVLGLALGLAGWL
ncbi:MAG TPA: hypothetical protein PKA56_04090 [Solirubrobacterales bacterium]|jgi:hypothetical protein|nr:hypothetical protein [Solirubrobacterales bacterium]HMW45377.1 hypothetical protein [Solirubrobacterales bacterium]HMX70913.1 hypothetical protein [Solirubrobacterales bacterium]HMY24861.1 hypothetical protein [Solirubrobacterales bacterium]HNA25019.1 hypothetical protein [Solirubrobacterales bacterium]